ncbi:MAG: hypothetical protein ACQESR_04545 [Planctomycetota bacterium]
MVHYFFIWTPEIAFIDLENNPSAVDAERHRASADVVGADLLSRWRLRKRRRIDDQQEDEHE